jgi:sporulation protein YlmC with PRC-barrel domain
MKKTLKWILCCGVCALTGVASAQVYYDGASPLTPTGTDTNRMTESRDAGESQKFCSSKDIVGADVKDAQGNKLGDIDDVLINPKSGETFASIGVSGGRYAVVPIKSLNVTRSAGLLRNAEVKLNATKASLESGPTVARNEWKNLDDPSFTQSIYSHYKLAKPSAMGGAEDAESGSMSGTSSDAYSSGAEKKAQPKGSDNR